MDIKFIGRYYSDNVLYQYLPDGTRRWRKKNGFMVKEMISGNIQLDEVEIELSGLAKQEIAMLIEGTSYMVLLALDKERIENIKDPLQITHEEVVLITKVND